MGILRKFSILTSIIIILIAVLYQLSIQPDSPYDMQSLLSEGGHYITLKDGRYLEYFKAGPDDALKKVLFFNGFMFTGKSIYSITKNEASKLNIQIISPTYPGFGKSSYKPNRTLDQYPDDIVQLLDHLNIKNFSLAGISLGASHACMIAYKLKDRADNILLINPTPDIFVDETDNILANILGLPVIKEIVNYFLVRPTLATRDSTYNFYMSMGPNSFGEIKDKEILNYILDDAKRAINDSLSGANDGLRIIKKPWPMDLSAIMKDKKRKVIIISGGKDDFNYPKNHLYYHSQMPGSVIIKEPDHGHLYPLINPTILFKHLNTLFEN